MIKLLRFLKPFRLYVAIVIILSFLQAIANLLLPTLMADIVDSGIVKGDTQYILRVGAIMLAVTVGGMICAIASSFFSSRAGTGFGKAIRRAIFSHVQDFSLHEFDKVSTASLITRTTNDTTQVQMVMVMGLGMMIGAPLMAIGGVVLAVSQDGALAWLLAGVVPIVFAVLYVLMGKAVPLFKSMQAKLDKLNHVLDEGLTGVRVIRAFNRMDHENQRFDEANLDVTNTALTVNRIMAVLWPAMMLIFNLSSIVMFWFGAIRINNGQMQIGNLLAFLQYAMMIMFSVLMVSFMFVIVPRASAAAARINEVLGIAPDIHDPVQPKSADAIKGHVAFEDVTFSYPGAEEPALSNVSFHAKPGEVTAIIGGTGSGKSTLVSLIPRFYDVDSGKILIDGVDLREMTQEALRSKIGFVPQKAVLFAGTVAENIRYGKEEASDEEVKRAAEISQASEFISGMAGGFDAEIAQVGTNVSGGQKQRLSIARALVRKPEIYVFDDSFSALDFKTDAKLREALKKETGDATVLIVAQRVGTVMDADRIIVLDEGRIAGIGNHRELMKSSEVYREIVSSQLSLEEIA
ncbi:MAG: ABC transporter ATP-binding protein/permease [Chloroflexi bacterium]|nr:ABC transporter ATP-binding protein/permease [Chloroflexota bacterium]